LPFQHSISVEYVKTKIFELKSSNLKIIGGFFTFRVLAGTKKD